MSLENDIGARILKETYPKFKLEEHTITNIMIARLCATVSTTGALVANSIDKLTRAVEQSAEITLVDNSGNEIKKDDNGAPYGTDD